MRVFTAPFEAVSTMALASAPSNLKDLQLIAQLHKTEEGPGGHTRWTLP